MPGVARAVWLTTSDGLRLHAWWKAPAVTLFLHGNAGNTVLVMDYRGYRRSEGQPTNRGVNLDADAAHDWLIAQGWPAGRIFF